MSFPTTRLRRLRRNEALRGFVRETRLSPEGFIYPMFICPGEGVRKPIGSMPGVSNLSVDEAVKEARELHSLGIPATILFGLPESKDEQATGAWEDDGIVQRATRAIKREVPDLLVLGDVCLCEYMSHGHCGIVRQVGAPQSVGAAAAKTAVLKTPKSKPAASREPEYEIVNDATLDLLARTAVSQARAGMDIIAPSDMMDGRVAAIRKALDDAGFSNIPILAYAAKYASGFYGPFREAMREIALDLQEGADMIMVKPALPYLDVIAAARRRFDVPIAAYQVSGEFAMIEAAARNGWIDRERIMLETLTSIQRAGAGMILTYFAKDVARLLA